MDSDALRQIIAQEHGEFTRVSKGQKITAISLKGKVDNKLVDLEYCIKHGYKTDYI